MNEQETNSFESKKAENRWTFEQGRAAAFAECLRMVDDLWNPSMNGHNEQSNSWKTGYVRSLFLLKNLLKTIIRDQVYDAPQDEQNSEEAR